MNEAKLQSPRIASIDFARGIALVAMAIFHFGWDLENFGLARAGMSVEPFWKYFARTIAASFLILVGLSSWLAHSKKFALPAFLKRMFYVGGAAVVITIATLYATPDGFIFFGILHNITLSSVLILLFMRLPISAILLAAILVLSAPFWARTPLLDHPMWWWSGLSQLTPQSNDYVPMFPWFGWVLAGLALAKSLTKWNLWQVLNRIELSAMPAKLLRFFGRFSLIFYLLHQPIMIGLLYAFIKFSAGI